MIPVKICGITNLEDAEICVNCGASALGFIFYDKSPRYILPETAREIAVDLKGQVSFAGVFVDETLDNVQATKEEITAVIFFISPIITCQDLQRYR